MCGICCKLNRKILFNPLPTCICNHIPHLLKCYIKYKILLSGGGGGGGGALLSGFNSKVKNKRYFRVAVIFGGPVIIGILRYTNKSYTKQILS